MNFPRIPAGVQKKVHKFYANSGFVVLASTDLKVRPVSAFEGLGSEARQSLSSSADLFSGSEPAHDGAQLRHWRKHAVCKGIKATYNHRQRNPASLNLIVRPMGTVSHRAIELLVGFALLGYGAYAIYTGRVMGKFRSYSRTENPGSFWTTVLIALGISTAFLFGAVSWRN